MEPLPVAVVAQRVERDVLDDGNVTYTDTPT